MSNATSGMLFLSGLAIAWIGCAEPATSVSTRPPIAPPEAPEVPRPSPPPRTAETADTTIEERSIAQILADEGRFRWSDGTSVYTMSADHGFSLGPVGLSGRTIDGKWRLVEDGSSNVEVFGRWRWINGVSRSDDYRRMVLDVRAPHTRRSEPDGLYEPFFLVEEVAPISAARFEAAMREIPGPVPPD